MHKDAQNSASFDKPKTSKDNNQLAHTLEDNRSPSLVQGQLKFKNKKNNSNESN